MWQCLFAVSLPHPFVRARTQLSLWFARCAYVAQAHVLRNHRFAKKLGGMSLCGGIIVTGARTLPAAVTTALDECGIPCLAVPAVVCAHSLLSATRCMDVCVCRWVWGTATIEEWRMGCDE
jgi:hypothetical protein